MKSPRVRLDEPTSLPLNRLAPGAKRAGFVRAPIRKAIRNAGEKRARQAYREQPDMETTADDWANAEVWKP